MHVEGSYLCLACQRPNTPHQLGEGKLQLMRFYAAYDIETWSCFDYAQAISADIADTDRLATVPFERQRHVTSSFVEQSKYSRQCQDPD